MEQSSDPSKQSKTSLRRNSKSHTSMSDTESATSQVDSFHSPLRSESPLRSGHTFIQPGNDGSGENNCRTIVLVNNYSSPLPSPGGSNVPAISPVDGGNSRRPWPRSEKPNLESPDFLESPLEEEESNVGRRFQQQPAGPENLDYPAKRVVGVRKFVKDEPSSEVKKMRPFGGGGGPEMEEGYVGGGREEVVGQERQSRAAVTSILKRSDRNAVVMKMALGFRVFEVIACLVSFSVMAADRTQGWSGDSFYRYIEYRILAYLLMSASSSAATRVNDWISNWGGDEFTMMATASITISFLAFVSFASSSLVSGYNLCNWDST
ncbi:hypothetical protein CASFOL_038350 [Castilleja foliolosa]|uniref:CASP-like protein n=1 Tax=Castilleja foliolosa TaxID=1961234 RepID=A0ABD3BL85_9LAMI